MPSSSLLDQAAIYLSKVSGVADPDALFVVWGGANVVRDSGVQDAVPNIATFISDLAFYGVNGSMLHTCGVT